MERRRERERESNKERKTKRLYNVFYNVGTTSTPDFWGEVGLNLALGLVTSCWSKSDCIWRPAYWGEGGSMSIGDPSKNH